MENRQHGYGDGQPQIYGGRAKVEIASQQAGCDGYESRTEDSFPQLFARGNKVDGNQEDRRVNSDGARGEAPDDAHRRRVGSNPNPRYGDGDRQNPGIEGPVVLSGWHQGHTARAADRPERQVQAQDLQDG